MNERLTLDLVLGAMLLLEIVRHQFALHSWKRERGELLDRLMAPDFASFKSHRRRDQGTDPFADTPDLGDEEGVPDYATARAFIDREMRDRAEIAEGPGSAAEGQSIVRGIAGR